MRFRPKRRGHVARRGRGSFKRRGRKSYGRRRGGVRPLRVGFRM